MLYDGYVVCQEMQDTLMDAWNVYAEEQERKVHEKKEKRVLENWRKLTKGLVMYHKIKRKYAKPEPISDEASASEQSSSTSKSSPTQTK